MTAYRAELPERPLARLDGPTRYVCDLPGWRPKTSEYSQNGHVSWPKRYRLERAARERVGDALMVAGWPRSLSDNGQGWTVGIFVWQQRGPIADQGDNQHAALKAVRDAIAKYLGVDDRPDGIRWAYVPWERGKDRTVLVLRGPAPDVEQEGKEAEGMSSREMLRDLIAEYGQFKVEQREERSRLYERRARLTAQVGALTAALLSFKRFDTADGACWCWKPWTPEQAEHEPECAVARAALANPDAAATRLLRDRERDLEALRRCAGELQDAVMERDAAQARVAVLEAAMRHALTSPFSVQPILEDALAATAEGGER